MILALPYYDPAGKHNQVFQRQLETLRSAFDAICMSVAPPTGQDNASFVQRLAEQGCLVLDNAPGSTLGDHSRQALWLALTHARAEQSIFFGFLDRVLFALETEWRDTFLQDLATYRADECLVLERSPLAWSTHPSNYREMEQMVSRTFQWLSGTFVELSPAALVLSRRAAHTILGQSQSASYDIWGEWVLLAMRNGIPVTTRQVDWLAWEDPYWEGADPADLKRAREASQEETLKRIRMNVPILMMLTEDRFHHLKR